ncbi:flavin reductase family protein [Variovorax sp.]|jgi:flavin reductase (DIM6/NTAB) family NADH-FMN oxidoreductase RutF|uniref:flavin reductase family protein n=1 Tax=Variovorax sp. TaxID=1871043 RepID=UPI0037DA27E5
MQTAFDPRLFRDIMGHFATGVTVVTYQCDGEARGMTANAFMSVSLDPPLATISVRRAARFAAVVREGDRFGVNFLLESQQSLSLHFGGKPIADLPSPFAAQVATPLLRESLAQLVLRTVAVHEAGDHLLYLGQVEQMALGEERQPLVFYGGAYKQVNLHAPRLFWSDNDGW